MSFLSIFFAFFFIFNIQKLFKKLHLIL